MIETLHAAIETFAHLPTKHGDFKIVMFSNNRDQKEHLALVYGEVQKKEEVLVRIHSECLTGDVFHSLRCDCYSQMDLALKQIAEEGAGVFLYMRQEGRGIGLTNKIKAYKLQDEGMDTFEANEALGFKGDERNYDLVAEMLKLLKVESVRLLTNNPQKISAVQDAGLEVAARVPLITEANKHNEEYLNVKREKGGHLLE